MIKKIISVFILLFMVSCAEDKEVSQKNLELSQIFLKTNKTTLTEKKQTDKLVEINNEKINSKVSKYINVILPYSGNKKFNKFVEDASILAYFDFKDKNGTEIRFFDFNLEKDFFGLKSFISNLPGDIVADFVIYEYDQKIASLFAGTPHRIYLVNDLFPYNDIDESINMRSINADYISQMEAILSYAINNQYESFYFLLPNIGESKNYVRFINKTLKEKGLALTMLEYYDPNDEKSLMISNKNLWKKMSSNENKALFAFVNYQNKWPVINQEWSKVEDLKKDNLYAIIDNFSQNLEDSAKVENKSLIFADLKTSTDSIFKNKFNKNFHYETLDVSNLTYDIISLILSYKDTADVKKFLNNDKGFSGVTGVFSFKDNNLVAKRNLFLSQYQKENLMNVISK